MRDLKAFFSPISIGNKNNSFFSLEKLGFHLTYFCKYSHTMLLPSRIWNQINLLMLFYYFFEGKNRIQAYI